MKKVFIALFSAALLLSCGGGKKKPVDPLEEVKSEVKACMESLVKDLDTESYDTVNEKYLSREFKFLLDKAHREEVQDSARVNSFERRLEFMYCDNNIWADIEGLGAAPVDVVALNVIDNENVIADVKFGTSTPKTYHLVRENGEWLVSDIILANSQFGGYSIKNAIGESLSFSNPNQAQPEVQERNLMTVYVSMNNEIMVTAGKYAPKMFSVDELDGLRELAKDFITANLPGGIWDVNYPELKAELDTISYKIATGHVLYYQTPVFNNKHVITLKVEPGASYNSYMKVIEALCGAYCDLRAEFAEEVYDGAELYAVEKGLCANRFPEMIIEGNVISVKKVLRPSPTEKKNIDVIKIVEDDVEVEEQELLPQDMREWDDYEDVDFMYVEEEIEEEIFDVVEEQPEFSGGTSALMKYFKDNIKYPEISRDNNSQGKTFVKFIVNSDGSIQDVEVIRSSGDIYLDKEAIRVIEAMPKWTPAKQSGKPVRVKYVLPVSFRLQ